MATTTLIPPPPTELTAILAQEQQLVLPAFNAQIAWELGTLLRTQLLAEIKPTVISISLASHPIQTLFQSALSGTVPDNEIWVARKRKTVLRFGCSSWYLKNKYGGDEILFAAKNGLGLEAGSYAIHGGGFPIRVRGVDAVVGVIVVSGLAQSEDHAIIAKVLREYLESIGEVLPPAIAGDELEKKKED